MSGLLILNKCCGDILTRSKIDKSVPFLPSHAQRYIYTQSVSIQTDMRKQPRIPASTILLKIVNFNKSNLFLFLNSQICLIF